MNTNLKFRLQIFTFLSARLSLFRAAKNINVVLKWDSSAPLTYNTNTFCRYKQPEQHKSVLPEKLKSIVKTLEKTDTKKLYPLEGEWIRSDEVIDSLCIVLAFEIPQFVEKSEYNISGILSYKFKEKFCQLDIPSFKITARDLTNNLFAVKSVDITGGKEEAFLSTLVANEENDLVVRVSPNAYTSLENILEFEFVLRKVNLPSRTKKFFYMDTIAGTTDGYFLVLEKESETIYNLNVFCRNQTGLHVLLHFLYQNIPDVAILPKKYKESMSEMPPSAEFFTQQTSEEASALKSTLKEFGKSLESQITLVETFCRKRLDQLPEELVEDKDEVDLNVGIQDYQNFRKQLSDLELNSDLLFAKIEKITTQTEPTSEVHME